MRQAGEQAAYDAGVPGLHPGAHQAPRPAEVPDQLRPERARSLHRDRAPLRPAGGRDRRQRRRVARRAACSTTSARRSTTRSRGRMPRSAATSRARYGVSPHRLQRHRRPPPGGRAGVGRGDRGADRGRDQRLATGRRGESLDNYVKRLDDLQQIALSFPGVERCFAIQAGREIRILVAPRGRRRRRRRAGSRATSCKRIEEQLQYPGQIKVTVIRETRAVDYAR